MQPIENCILRESPVGGSRHQIGWLFFGPTPSCLIFFSLYSVYFLRDIILSIKNSICTTGQSHDRSQCDRSGCTFSFRILYVAHSPRCALSRTIVCIICATELPQGASKSYTSECICNNVHHDQGSRGVHRSLKVWKHAK